MERLLRYSRTAERTSEPIITSYPEHKKNTLMESYVNEIELSYKRKPVEKLSDPTVNISSPEIANEVLRQIFPENEIDLRENFYVLYLNHRKQLMGFYRVSIGSNRATIVDPADVIRVALLTGASSLLLSHNHPSGTTKFSSADINITKRIKKAGELFGIDLADHVVLTSETYISMRAEYLKNNSKKSNSSL